jgi:hypothetical protein
MLNLIYYTSYFIIFVLVCVCLFNSNLELIGFGLLFVINLITSLHIANDIINYKLNNDIIVFILSIGLTFTFVSIFLMLITLGSLHIKYTKAGTPIVLSTKNRKKLDDFKIIVITNICVLGVLCFLYLISNKSFFFIDFNSQYLLNFFILFIKIIFSIGTVGMSSYLVYLSNIFSKLGYSQLLV